MNTELYLLRHGEPEIRNALLGKTDSPLTSFGWKQLCNMAERLTGITNLVTSPLVRCSKFATYWASKFGVPLEINSDFQECNFGEWDGLSFDMIKEKYSSGLSHFLIEPENFTPNGGEALIDFQERVRNGINDLLVKNAGKKVLIVTHAGVIRCLVSWCLKIDPLSSVPFQNISVDYGSVTHISVYHGEQLFPQLKSLNVNRNIDL